MLHFTMSYKKFVFATSVVKFKLSRHLALLALQCSEGFSQCHFGMFALVDLVTCKFMFPRLDYDYAIQFRNIGYSVISFELPTHPVPG